MARARSETNRRPRERGPELWIRGLNACLAVAEGRPEDVRRVYLRESRLRAFGPLLRECARRRVAYHVVDDDELTKITGSVHHEGVCLRVRERPPPSLAALLADLEGRTPARLLYLDGVQNPHNLGAILRVAAHFGVAGVLARGEQLSLSPALCRAAEGACEWVPLVPVAPGPGPLLAVRGAGLHLLAAAPGASAGLFDEALPARALILLGAEDRGLSKKTRALVDRVVAIPGAGRVESLNVACAAAVALAEHWRVHPQQSSAAVTGSGRSRTARRR